MIRVLEIATVFVTALAISLALAHALEWPGKRRLDQQTYRAVQTIYYPGLTFGGFSEWIAIVAMIAVLWTTPRDATQFVWFASALISLVAMHAVYWVVTHPVNKFWLAGANFVAAWRQVFQNRFGDGRQGTSLRDRAVETVARAVGIFSRRSHLPRSVGAARSAACVGEVMPSMKDFFPLRRHHG